MFAIRTMGVVIALSATAVFAGDQGAAQGNAAEGDGNVLRTDETQARSTLTREAVIADFQAARAAGQIPSGDQ